MRLRLREYLARLRHRAAPWPRQLLRVPCTRSLVGKVQGQQPSPASASKENKQARNLAEDIYISRTREIRFLTKLKSRVRANDLRCGLALITRSKMDGHTVDLLLEDRKVFCSPGDRARRHSSRAINPFWIARYCLSVLFVSFAAENTRLLAGERYFVGGIRPAAARFHSSGKHVYQDLGPIPREALLPKVISECWPTYRDEFAPVGKIS